jgi:hypothetical protein
VGVVLEQKNSGGQPVCAEGRPFLSTVADFGSGAAAWVEMVTYDKFINRLGFQPWAEPADSVGIMSGEFGAVAFALDSNACYQDFLALTREQAAQIAGREE